MLLGSIFAVAYGDPRAVAKSKPMHVELLACLALHPQGVSVTRLAEDFHARRERIRNLASNVRRWLGTDQRTGDLYFPHAAPATDSGGTRYRVRGVLVDTDLFDRLNARAGRREAAGFEATDDLVAALCLVRGAPLSDPRDKGWSWLFDRERTDQIVNAAVARTAHTVANRALEAEDYDRAHWAVRVGNWAAPDDEVIRDDLLMTECVRRALNRERLLGDYLAISRGSRYS